MEGCTSGQEHKPKQADTHQVSNFVSEPFNRHVGSTTTVADFSKQQGGSSLHRQHSKRNETYPTEPDHVDFQTGSATQTVSRQLSATSALSNSSTSDISVQSTYQQWAGTEMEPVYPDELLARDLEQRRQSMQLELLSRCTPELQHALYPILARMGYKEMVVLTGDALPHSQKANMLRHLEANVEDVMALQQELCRWRDKALFQDRVRYAEQMQQQQKQEREKAEQERRTLDQELHQQASKWNPETGQMAASAWQDAFVERYALAQQHFDHAAQHTHSTHTDIFRSFLVASRWAGLPYWHHPASHTQPPAALGEPSSCSLCCEALGIPKLAPPAQQHGVKRLFSSCFGLSSGQPALQQPPSISGSTTANTGRAVSLAAGPSIIRDEGQNWESQFIDPAKVFAQHEVQDTFGNADFAVLSRSGKSPVRRGSSIYWEDYVASQPSAQGSTGPPRRNLLTRTWSSRKLMQLFSNIYRQDD